MISWVDTHCHLPLLEHLSAEEAIRNAKAAHVETLITVATESANWDSSRDFAHRYPNVYYSIGLHPHEASHLTECAVRLPEFFPSNKPDNRCVAIGEIGLDYYYDHSPREMQIHALEEQLGLAKKLELPVIFHCRDAFSEMFDCVKRVGLSSRGGVMHCFTGSYPNASDALDLGLYISFSGILTFKNADDLRATATKLPKDRILLETDCPFLAPVPHRGQPNQPSLLPHTGEVLAKCRGLSLESAAELTTTNARTLFKLM